MCSSDLKELMNTLKASSAALKKAGVGTGVKEAEAVMSELDEQMREASELTQVLSNQTLELDMEFDLEEELESLLQDNNDSEKTISISNKKGDNNKDGEYYWKPNNNNILDLKFSMHSTRIS